MWPMNKFNLSTPCVVYKFGRAKPSRFSGSYTLLLAVCRLRCSFGRRAMYTRDIILSQSLRASNRSGGWYLIFGSKYCMYDVNASCLIKLDPVILVQYVRAWARNTATPPLLQPLGVIHTPSVLNESVGSICFIIVLVVSNPQVRWSWPDNVSFVCRMGFPLLHFQDSRNQKHLSRFKATPVVYSNFSHSCAKHCRLFISSLTLLIWGLVCPP